ncbi:hypothetical protein V6N11_009710 [Hibiscus sabdariffa]|uniref:Uncharacterized protein n=1 Tax=Hibiscus sabdariffa TaxID=183260 RepID=A0ABR2P6K3_9ROSI
MEDAMRAQERLDGFSIYGFRVRVHLARLDSNNMQGRNKDPWRKKIDEPDNRRAEEKSDLVQRVTGVLDLDKRIILNNCLVGRCNKFMRAHILAKELHDEGITGASIMNISYQCGVRKLSRTSMNSKENQRVNVDVGEQRNESSGFSDENSGMDSSMEARQTCADVESRGALTGSREMNPLEPNTISEDYQQQPAPLSSIAANIDQELCSKESNDSFEINPGLQNGSVSIPRATSVADKQMIDGFEDIEEGSHRVSDFGNSRGLGLRRLTKPTQKENVEIRRLAGQKNFTLEVEAGSPTNSDIARKQILTRSARKALALGKRIHW